MSDALEDLQTRFAHQELAIEALNEVFVRQGRQIDDLRAALDRLQQELRELRPSPLDADGGSEPPPPHY
ncbi:MAG: SlyX family protein [Gammaproteobacteria bacterium]|nr:SlyX family protein [Gammaproteobacteria bacterium]